MIPKWVLLVCETEAGNRAQRWTYHNDQPWDETTAWDHAVATLDSAFRKYEKDRTTRTWYCDPDAVPRWWKEQTS